MSLIYSAIVPHAPLLLPSIGKEITEKLQPSIQALEAVNKRLIELDPETIVMITPRSEVSKSDADVFYIHMPGEYKADFKEFGDLETTMSFTPDHFLADMIKRTLSEKKLNVQYHSEENLEYDASVPLYYLTKGLKAKIIIVHPSLDALKQQFKFGKELQKPLQETDKRVALIASAELSHRLSDLSPAGFWPNAKKFDHDIIEAMQGKRSRKLMSLNEETLREAQSCGIPALTVLLGAIDHMKCTPERLAYDGTIGIGQLTMEYLF